MATSPAAALVVVSIFGLTTFSALFVAGVTMTGMKDWLLGEPDVLVTLIGSATVFAGLIFTSKSLRADVQAKADEARSRRVEQFAERIRQFRTPSTNAAMMILLNYDRDVVIREHVGPERVSWEDAAKALVPGSFRHYYYEPELTAIRDCFNDMLEGMSRLHFLLSLDLVRREDVDHICHPLLTRLVRDPMFSGRPLARNLRLYILWRNSRGVMRLLERYQLPIASMRQADEAALRADIASGVYGDCQDTGWGDLEAPPTARNGSIV